MQIMPLPRDHLNKFPWQKGFNGCKTKEIQMHRMDEKMG